MTTWHVTFEHENGKDSIVFRVRAIDKAHAYQRAILICPEMGKGIWNQVGNEPGSAVGKGVSASDLRTLPAKPPVIQPGDRIEILKVDYSRPGMPPQVVDVLHTGVFQAWGSAGDGTETWPCAIYYNPDHGLYAHVDFGRFRRKE